MRRKPALFDETNKIAIAIVSDPWEIIETRPLGYPRNVYSYPRIVYTTVNMTNPTFAIATMTLCQTQDLYKVEGSSITSTKIEIFWIWKLFQKAVIISFSKMVTKSSFYQIYVRDMYNFGVKTYYAKLGA